jgi:dynein heavy chain 2
MSAPDLEQISEVILYSEGFMSAKILGQKLVTAFNLSRQLLSPQQHYDWGLRALKTVLNSGGGILLNERRTNKNPDYSAESRALVQALRINTLSKLTWADSKRFNALCEDIWPGLEATDVSYAELEASITVSIIFNFFNKIK